MNFFALIFDDFGCLAEFWGFEMGLSQLWLETQRLGAVVMQFNCPKFLDPGFHGSTPRDRDDSIKYIIL